MSESIIATGVSYLYTWFVGSRGSVRGEGGREGGWFFFPVPPPKKNNFSRGLRERVRVCEGRKDGRKECLGSFLSEFLLPEGVSTQLTK